MRTLTLLNGLRLICVVMIAGCQDPKDPQTWIAKLRKPEHANAAVRKLVDLNDPVAVKPLCDLFKDFPSATILKAIISFKSGDSVPTLIEALDFQEDRYHNATLAAEALADLGAKEAVPALINLLDRKLSIKSRANKAKVSAIAALAKLGGDQAVPALIKIAEGRPEYQDFYLNKRAVMALGTMRAEAAVPVLIRALFMQSTLQGTSFPQARVALVQIGKPAVAPLIAALKGEDEDLNKMAKELEFKPGVIKYKTTMVLGDLRAKDAVGTLLRLLASADLAQGNNVMGVVEALGKLRDPAAVAPLISLLRNTKADYKLRIQACAALTVLGDKRAIAPLLETAEKGYVNGGYWNLREAAALAYSRIVGSEAAKGVDRLNAVLLDPATKDYKQTQAVLQEAIDRTKLAIECKDDVSCYANKLSDTKLSLAQREKAGIMVGILPGGEKVLSKLVAALPVREPILRQFYLESAKNIGKATDNDLVAVLRKLVAKDSKRAIKFLGADLATADRIALATVLRN